MTRTLQDYSVDETYQGVLHAGGVAMPATGLVDIYDGSGQKSSLAIGLTGEGIRISGSLSMTGALSSGELLFTNVDSISGAGFPLISNGEGTVDFGQISVDALEDLDPNPAGTYSQIDSIEVNAKGLVTDILVSPIRQCWVNFDGVPVTSISYQVSGTRVECNKSSHGFATGQIISVSASDAALAGAYPVTVLDSNNFTFPTPTGTVLITGNLLVSTAIRSGYNVASVTRTGVGKYLIRFNETYNNNQYMTQVSKGSLSNIAANPGTPATGENGWAIVLNQYSTGVEVYSQNGDCTNMNVFAIGNTLIYANDEPKIVYDNFNYRNYYYLAEKGESGNCSINTGVLAYTIDKDYMANNKLAAVEISVRGYDNCKAGSYALNFTSVVQDINAVTHTSNFTRTTTGGGQPKANDRVAAVILFVDNKLYYKNLYSGVTSVTANNFTDYKTKDANKLLNIDRRARAFCYKNRSGTGTCPSYLTDIVTSLSGFQAAPEESPLFIPINSATITLNLRAAHSGSCDGGIAAFNYIKEFYIPYYNI